VTIAYSENVAFNQFMDAVIAIHSSPDYATLRFVVHDMLSVQAWDFSNVDLTLISSHELGARYTNPHVKVALVSTHPKLQELTLSFRDMTELDIRFFSSLEPAREWTEKNHTLSI
jgi:hypothetical protein